MSALPQLARLTHAEYFALEQAGDLKHEYVDGYVYAMAGGSEAHNLITANVLAAFHGGRPPGCRVYTSDMLVHVAELDKFFYPDVVVTCGERLFLPDAPIATLLNPTLIVEVLSPSTELYDRTTKFDAYRRLESLRDYVLVTQHAPQIGVFSRSEGESWIFREATGLDAGLHLPSLALTLALTDAYTDVDFDENAASPRGPLPR